MTQLMLPASALEALIYAATALVAISPVVLVILWLKEHKQGQLW